MPRTLSNSILNRLPPTQRKALIARMEMIPLPVGKVLTTPGELPKYAHFMVAGITSVVTYMKNGAAAEVGLVGNEGLVEAMHLLGSANAPTTAFVQVEGSALRIPFEEIQEEVCAVGPLFQGILEFVQRQNFTLTQLAACNGLHEIEERLARWLLMVQDRVDSPKFDLTQEFLAGMLSARRSSVTLAAGRLQQSGLIQYRRGRIQILNREKLQIAACECYPIVRDLVDGYSR